MKRALLICFILISGLSFGQLKKKYYGTYRGTVPSYTIDIGSDVVPVASSEIVIQLTAENVTQQLGNVSRKGSWTVSESDKTHITLNLRLEGQLAEERLLIDKKTKKIVRLGIFPQPDALLEKDRSS